MAQRGQGGRRRTRSSSKGLSKGEKERLAKRDSDGEKTENVRGAWGDARPLSGKVRRGLGPALRLAALTPAASSGPSFRRNGCRCPPARPDGSRATRQGCGSVREPARRPLLDGPQVPV